MADANLEQVKHIKQTLLSALEGQLSNGVENVGAYEAGLVADIIKDLAETEMLCYKAKYYKSVSDAMEDYDEDEADWNEDLRMGYSRNSYPAPRMRRPSYRMGYMPMDDGRSYGDVDYPNMNRYYDDAARYGRSYNEYRRARRNYTETHSDSDKKDMDMMGERHVKNAIDSIKDIWAQADPNLKMQMKNDIAHLVEDMKLS